MTQTFISLVFFLYGLSFFSMGLVVLIEGGRGSDRRLKLALRPLAVFGLLHASHEWLEMFQLLGLFPTQPETGVPWEGIRLTILAVSFLSLTAFGVSLIAPTEKVRRFSLALPFIQVVLWLAGLFIMRGIYSADVLQDVIDVWSRYALGIPAAIIAAIGLVFQQRAFRQAGMIKFGRDTLWAAAAFAWYGLLGQLFTRATPLPPSTFLNQELFLQWFGFPVQLMRAVSAWVAAIFIIRSLRAFEVERQRQITQLHEEKLGEAQRREILRGELLRRVVAAQEAERQRIARELHDEMGQSLTAVGLGLHGVTSTLKQNPEGAAANLVQLEKLVAHSLDELQRLIADLRPSHLDDLGLPAALRWWAEEAEHRGSLRVSVTITGPEQELTSPVRLALFRVTQEAITNVIKHANASQAEILLQYAPDHVQVTVHDNGCGFDLNRVAVDEFRPSWGLLGMNERATLLGGSFTIETEPGQGTTVNITIPYRQKVENENLEENHDHTTAAR